MRDFAVGVRAASEILGHQVFTALHHHNDKALQRNKEGARKALRVAWDACHDMTYLWGVILQHSQFLGITQPARGRMGGGWSERSTARAAL